MKAIGVGFVNFGAWMGGCTFVEAGHHWVAMHLVWFVFVAAGSIMAGAERS